MKFFLKNKNIHHFYSLLIIIAGLLPIKHFFNNSLVYFVYPGYNYFIVISGLIILIVGFFLFFTSKTSPFPSIGLSSILFFIILIIGFIFVPQPLSVETALTRGVVTNVNLTEIPNSTFKNFQNTGSSMTILDWVKHLNSNPEPNFYKNKEVDLTGFVIDHNEDYFYIARFIISCCAADARPIALPVLKDNSFDQIKEGDWISVQGEFTEHIDIDQHRIVIIKLNQLNKIDPPKNPYVYQ